MLDFAAPAMFGGLALLTLPLIAHLLHRHVRRRVVFPTVRLLQASAASQSRLFRVRRRLLLALRCLLVALIVAAFSGPLWVDAGVSSEAAGDQTGVVLLVDASASSAQTADGTALVNRLRSAAERTLDSLTSGADSANVVVASAKPYVVFPRLSANLPALRSELGRLDSSYERADLLRAVALAGEQLTPFRGRRRLVILSDLQASNWQDVLARSNLAELLPAGTRVTVVEPETGVAENVGLSAPHAFPAQPLAGQSMRLAAQLTNFSSREKQVRVQLRVGEIDAGEQTVALAAGEQRDVAFAASAPANGEQGVRFAIGGDGLAADNEAFLIVRTAARLPVVVIGDDDPNEPGTGLFYLLRALAPHNDREDRFEVQSLRSADVAPDRLTNAAAVFVTYVGELNETAATALSQYIQNGGGVVFFCGEGSAGRNLQALERAGGDLPWQPGSPRRVPDRDVLRITGGQWRSRFLREFDEQSQIAIGQIPFRQIWTAGAVDPQAQVLLTFSDGTPALGARPVGTGQLLLANFSPSLTSSDLGKYGAFVALVQVLARELRPSAEEQARGIAGEPYRAPHTVAYRPEDGRLQLVDPAGETVAVPMPLEARELTLEIPEPKAPGVYEFRAGSKTISLAAINVDPRESDLRRIAHSSLLEIFERQGFGAEARTAGGWDPLLPTRGRPLWNWCLFAAMAVLGMELLLVSIWRR